MLIQSFSTASSGTSVQFTASFPVSKKSGAEKYQPFPFASVQASIAQFFCVPRLSGINQVFHNSIGLLGSVMSNPLIEDLPPPPLAPMIGQIIVLPLNAGG